MAWFRGITLTHLEKEVGEDDAETIRGTKESGIKICKQTNFVSASI